MLGDLERWEAIWVAQAGAKICSRVSLSVLAQKTVDKREEITLINCRDSVCVCVVDLVVQIHSHPLPEEARIADTFSA